MSEYFEPIEEIPRRLNTPKYEELLKEFLSSNLKIVRLKNDYVKQQDRFNYSACLSRFCKVHKIPVLIHCVSGIIYLEKVS